MPMEELKQGFERLNYTEVKTYLNSCNVIFSSDEADTIKIISRIEEMIKNQFSLDIPVFVISEENRKRWYHKTIETSISISYKIW